MSEKKIDSTVDIFGIPVFSGGKAKALEQVGEKLATAGVLEPLVVFTPTTEQVVMAQHDDLLCASFQKSDLNLPDTLGLIWASRGRLAERVPGVDMAECLVDLAAEKGLKVFLLGGKGETAGGACQVLRAKYPGLQIRGEEGISDIKSQFSITNFQSNSNDKFQINHTEHVIEEINNWGTDLLLVAFGAPWQERFVTEYKKDLKVKVAMVVGGAFDMWAKNVPRAPLWVRKIGLEWLWRLMIQPWRIKRQLRLVEFVGMMLKRKPINQLAS
jgi:N-acetylglucosaminyldiphosphoundecaprenol N-acetyl-beta-D-mannosaminyltransferase